MGCGESAVVIKSGSHDQVKRQESGSNRAQRPRVTSNKQEPIQRPVQQNAKIGKTVFVCSGIIGPATTQQPIDTPIPDRPKPKEPPCPPSNQSSIMPQPKEPNQSSAMPEPIVSISTPKPPPRHKHPIKPLDSLASVASAITSRTGAGSPNRASVSSPQSTTLSSVHSTDSSPCLDEISPDNITLEAIPSLHCLQSARPPKKKRGGPRPSIETFDSSIIAPTEPAPRLPDWDPTRVSVMLVRIGDLPDMEWLEGGKYEVRWASPDRFVQMVEHGGLNRMRCIIVAPMPKTALDRVIQQMLDWNSYGGVIVFLCDALHNWGFHVKMELIECEPFTGPVFDRVKLPDRRHAFPIAPTRGPLRWAGKSKTDVPYFFANLGLALIQTSLGPDTPAPERKLFKTLLGELCGLPKSNK